MLFSHAGLRGDVIWSLPVARLFDGPRIFLINPEAGYPHQSRPLPWGVIEGLVEMLSEALFPDEFQEVRTRQPGEEVHVDLSLFRQHLDRKSHLLDLHLRGAGKNSPAGEEWLRPWLQRKRWESGLRGQVVLNFTGRYQPARWEWLEIIRRHRDRIQFVGTGPEHQKIQELAGCRLRHWKTPSTLEFYRAISSAEAFIGNSSFGWAISQGLGMRSCLIGDDSSNVRPVRSAPREQGEDVVESWKDDLGRWFAGVRSEIPLA